MKITYVIQEYWPAKGGGPQALHERVKVLRENSVESTILTTNFVNIHKKETITKEVLKNDDKGVIRHKAININPNFLIPLGVIRSLLTTRGDIIHAIGFGYFSTEVAAFISKLRNKPFCFSPAGYFPSAKQVNGLLTSIYIFLAKKNSLKTAKLIFVDSEDDRNIYSKLTAQDKIVVLPGVAVSETLISYKANPIRFKEKFRIKGKYFFSVGRIIESKGFQNVIRAIPKMLKIPDLADIKYVIAGTDQGYTKLLKNMIIDLKCSENVIIINEITETDKYDGLSGAVGLIVPSNFETYGIVIVEAMALGVPVICTKFGGAKEKLPTDVFSFLIDPRNPDSIIDSFKWATNLSTQKREMISQISREIVKSGHTVEATTFKLINLYKEIIEGKI